MSFDGDNDNKDATNINILTQDKISVHNSNENIETNRFESAEPNRILLFNILHPRCQVTVDVLHNICKRYGQVQRIIIFKRRTIMALVEFDNIESATRVRDNFNKRRIYGYFELKVFYSKLSKLNIKYENRITSRIYTLTLASKAVGYGRSLIRKRPYFGTNPQQTNMLFLKPGVTFPSSPHLNFHLNHESRHVIMVYGLDPKTSNPDKLFNLLWSYGYIAKIKFLKSIKGGAMVQMGDYMGAERCIKYLNGIYIGNNRHLSLSFAKQRFVTKPMKPYLLPDNTPSFKNYIKSINNNFVCRTDRIQPPNKVLYYTKTPPELNEAQLMEIFIGRGITPISVTVFPLEDEGWSSGLIEFSDIQTSILAIMEFNHLSIKGNDSAMHFGMKLSFSSVESMRD